MQCLVVGPIQSPRREDDDPRGIQVRAIMAGKGVDNGKSRAPEQGPLLSAPGPAAGPSYNALNYSTIYDPHSPEALRYADARARTRTVKAIALGFLLYACAGFILGFGLMGSSGSGWRRGRFRIQPPTWPGRPDPAPSDGTPLECGSFAPTAPDEMATFVATNATNAAFTLKVGKADGLFLSARGALARGKVTFIVAKPTNALATGDGRKSVLVEVSARYDDRRLVELATVCTMERKLGNGAYDRGIGIYTPSVDLPAASSHISFDIRITIPSDAVIDSLGVHATLLAITGGLPPSTFRRVQLSTLDAPIALSTVSGQDMRISTTNGAISGYFNVSEQLVLATSNGAITAEVGISPAQGSNSTSVSATTSNGAIRLDYDYQPLHHKLISRAATSNGATYVQMHPHYEGEFEIRTSWGQARQLGPQSMHEDGLDRRIEITHDDRKIGSSYLAGTVWWTGSGHNDTDRSKRGSTEVTTATGAANLLFK